MEAPLRAPRQPVLVGVGLLLTAVLVAVMVPSHLADQLENITWDLRVRTMPRAWNDPRIVLIDIDDSSLQQLGRWPWPRREVARLIETLHDAGAGAVALDIEFPEPQPPDLVPLLTVYRQVAVRPVDNDAILADAVARCGPVFLAANAEPAYAAGDAAAPRPAILARAEADLYADEAAVARDLGIALEQAARELAAAKRRVIRRRLQQWVDREGLPPADVAETAAVRAVLGEAAVDVEPYEGRLVREQMQHLMAVRAMAAGTRFGPLAVPELAGLTPPLPAFAAGGRVGLTSVVPDPHDYVVRRLPLLAQYEGRTYPHLSFALAADLLDAPPEAVTVEPGRWVTLACRDGRQVRIPVDEQCRMLVNWAQHGPGALDNFVHIAVKDVAAVWRTAEEIRTNRMRFEERAEAAFFPEREYFTWLGELDRARQERIRLPPAGEGASRPATAAALDARIAELEGQIRRREADHRQMVEMVAEADPADPTLSPEDRQQVLAARALKQLLGQVDAANAENRKIVDAAMARLKQLVGGRVCLVGSIATGAADFVPTPLMARTPGVLVHANAVNTILTGRFIRVPPAWLAFLLPIGIGVATSLLAARLRPSWAILYAVAAVLLWFAAAIAVHLAADLWLPMAMPLLGVVLPWAGVVGLRQLIEERRSRWISRKFGQYTSPALLKRISEGDRLSLEGERRVLTVFISDLRGFTRLSEQLGPMRTVQLLNRYFAVMTQRLFALDSFVAKYVGDGIFAFFSAPVAQADHALRACRAALACLEALEQLKKDLAGEDAPDLRMGIGIGTGPVVVGNCGSELKFDYTVIGDTVNVASRLEGANKAFGTCVLLNEAAALAAGDEMLTRRLGRVHVVGRAEPLAAYELLASREQASDAVRQLADAFAAARADYEARRWPQAAEGFRRCLDIAPDDGPAALYLRLCDQYAAAPPPDDWDGALQLESK